MHEGGFLPMKILVFSDTHGRYREMRAALARHAPTTYAVFFLGDGCRDLSRIKDDFPTVAFYSVLGNCDFGATGDGDIYERFVSLDGFCFLLMHGHRFGVKSGLESAVAYAKNKGADVLLYGHTHQACDTLDGELYVFNPGSISGDYNGNRTYGILQTVNGVLVRSHANLSGLEI
jgi:putative phosphoesterase